MTARSSENGCEIRPTKKPGGVLSSKLPNYQLGQGFPLNNTLALAASRFLKVLILNYQVTNLPNYQIVAASKLPALQRG
jgi:hypothetical protein